MKFEPGCVYRHVRCLDVCILVVRSEKFSDFSELRVRWFMVGGRDLNAVDEITIEDKDQEKWIEC